MSAPHDPSILSAVVPMPTPPPPDPEVLARPQARQVTAAYKLRLLQAADHCPIGQLGALLRREGLSSSHLATWRRQRARGTLAALTSPPRGRPAPSREAPALARGRREHERLTSE